MSLENHPTVRFITGLRALAWLALSHLAFGLGGLVLGMWLEWALTRP